MTTRVPPHNEDAENAVLGASMLSHDSLITTISRLSPDMFYKPSNKIIFEAILEVDGNGIAVDQLSVVEELKKRGKLKGAGGSLNVSSLTDVPSTANTEYFAGLVSESASLRGLIQMTQKLSNDAYDSGATINGLLADADVGMINLFEKHNGVRKESFADQAEAWANALKEALVTGGRTGIQTGYEAYDAMTGGLQSSHFVVIGARPKVGKTTWGLNIAYNIASRNIPIGVVSLEMGADELITKMVGMDSRVTGLKFLTEAKLRLALEAKEKILHLPLTIIDDIQSDYKAILNQCRQMVRKDGVKVIFIDYLQLMTGNPKHGRVNEISEITRSIKQFTRRYKVPIVLLSQLNRLSEHEKREPIMSDLRDSGSVEQDANVIVLLHPDGDDMLKMKVVGNRAGDTGFFKCVFRRNESKLDEVKYNQ